MEVTFGLEHDLIYDVPLVQRMGAIGLKDLTYGGDELIEIKLQKQDAPPGRPVSAVDGVTSKYGY